MAQVVPAHMSSEAQLKVWQTWPGAHSFCCDGRVMLGPDIKVTYFAAGLTTAACIAFWVVVCPSSDWYVTLGSVFLYLLTIGFMAATATTDPGIIPRNTAIDDATAAANAQQSRSVEVNGVRIPLKWCRTCKIFRPPRAAHCSECNVCVERFDHHCPWMGQCIGRRNYRFFLGFVISVCMLAVFVAFFSASMALRVARAAYSSSRHPLLTDLLGKAVSLEPVAAVTVGFPCLILLCVGPLACYHCTLVCQNKTTAEEIKLPYGDANPFYKGCSRNCREVCCSASNRVIQPRSLASEDMGTAAMLSDEGEPNDHSETTEFHDRHSSSFDSSTAINCDSSTPMVSDSHNTAPIMSVNERPDVAMCRSYKEDNVLPV